MGAVVGVKEGAVGMEEEPPPSAGARGMEMEGSVLCRGIQRAGFCWRAAAEPWMG